MSKLIYVVDDESNIRTMMQLFLENEGFTVETFKDGQEACQAFSAKEPDMLILDIMMPGIDGLSLCTYFRRQSHVPIIFVSAKDTPSTVSVNYPEVMMRHKSPFPSTEFVARVKALFRRSDPHFYDASMTDPVTRFICGNLVLFPVSHRVTIQERDLNVTPTEFDFLLYMIQRADNAVSKKELAEQVWHFQGPDPEADIPEDFIKRLRKKLLSFGSTALIETVWGFGYRMSERRPERDRTMIERVSRHVYFLQFFS